ncbi:MAG: hypothetical protein ACLBM4_01720 [Dolichospermum sp.]
MKKRETVGFHTSTQPNNISDRTLTERSLPYWYKDKAHQQQ